MFEPVGFYQPNIFITMPYILVYITAKKLLRMIFFPNSFAF